MSLNVIKKILKQNLLEISNTKLDLYSTKKPKTHQINIYQKSSKGNKLHPFTTQGKPIHNTR